jgi:hypothetical protein
METGVIGNTPGSGPGDGHAQWRFESSVSSKRKEEKPVGILIVIVVLLALGKLGTRAAERASQSWQRSKPRFLLPFILIALFLAMAAAGHH